MKITNVVPESVYRGYDGVNYSSLSNLASSPQSFRIEEQKGDIETPAMLLGTVVDLLLTNRDRFDKEVYVMTAGKPSAEMMIKYCHVLAQTGDALTAHAESGYKLGPAAVATKFDKEGRAYYDALLKGEGKKIIDAEGMFTANQIVKTLQENPFTKKYFIEEDGVDLLFQVPITWDIPFKSLITGDNVTESAKSMLDVIRIDHHNKLIQPTDLKTGGEGFMKSYWRYHRYLQGSMYTDAVMASGWDNEQIADYRIEPMRFVFADTNLFYNPVVYKMTEKDVLGGRNGVNYLEPIGDVDVRLTDLGLIKRKGYIQLTAELDWHRKNNMWEYSYDIYQKYGEVDINAFAIKL